MHNYIRNVESFDCPIKSFSFIVVSCNRYTPMILKKVGRNIDIPLHREHNLENQTDTVIGLSYGCLSNVFSLVVYDKKNNNRMIICIGLI